MGGPRTECQILQGIEDGDEEEKAAKVTEGLQVRNWVENDECVCPKSQNEENISGKESDHLCQMLMLNQRGMRILQWIYQYRGFGA